MNFKNIIYKSTSLIILILLSLPIMIYINSTGLIQGADIWGHLYKTDILYNNILDGNFFVLYDEQWYNGIQMFRYWPPLSYYILAGFQFICGGIIENAYVLFVGFSFIFSGYAWILIGSLENKKILGLIIAILYWFLPDNLRILFCEGNLPRIFFVLLLPYFIYFIWNFIHYKKKLYIIPIILMSIIFILTHLMMSAIVGIGITIFLFLYFISIKDFKMPFFCMLGIICGYISGGLVLLPGLMGGIISQNSSASIATISDWSQELGISLNPLNRLSEPTIYYFGLSIFIISILGIRLAIIKGNKILIPGFITTIIIMISTSSSLTDFIEILPMSQVWWMERFTVIASVLFCLTLFLFKNNEIKKIGFIIFIMMIIIDIVPSLKLMGNITGNTILETEKKYNEYFLYDKAEQITNNRLTILDESLFGSYESFFIKNKKINITTGWALQGAQTQENIVYLNEALACNAYSYLFDRVIKLGSDTLIINKSLIDISEIDILKEVGNKYGYKIIDENNNCILFKFNDINYNFGVSSEYENIAIGSASRYISLIYPSFKNGTQIYIDDYTITELIEYKKIYLSGSFYKNKQKAELMIKELSNNGVQIYIDINNIEQDFKGYLNFLDVSARILTLINYFPNIIYENNEYQINLNMIENWNAAYITNSTDDDENFIYSHQTYAYLRRDNNITYIGMNLVYFYNQYPSKELKTILDKIFNTTQEDEYIEQNIYKIDIDIDNKNNIIKINSPENNLNTTLSYQDFFESNQDLINDDNLLVVNKGETIIKFSYKYFIEGIFISIIGLILSIILVITVLKTKGVENE